MNELADSDETVEHEFSNGTRRRHSTRAGKSIRCLRLLWQTAATVNRSAIGYTQELLY